MKHYGFIMLMVVLLLVSMPLSAVDQGLTNDELSSMPSETKINVREEVGNILVIFPETMNTFFVFRSMQGLESCWSGNRQLNYTTTAVFMDAIIYKKFSHPKLVPRLSGH
jgi:hypothetical protein